MSQWAKLYSQPKKRGGGLTAQRQGDLAESQVDLSLRRYRAEGLADGVATYPKVLVIGFDKRQNCVLARFTEQGTPDRAIAIKALGGRLCWLEIKTWQAENKHTLIKRIHQFHLMQNAITDGGALGFYLVKWRTKTGDDWRLYPVQSLTEDELQIVFRRKQGQAVSEADGYPDWLPPVLEFAGRSAVTR